MLIKCPVCGTYLKTDLGDNCFDKSKLMHNANDCPETRNKVVKCPICGTIFGLKILYSRPIEKNAKIVELSASNIENKGENKFGLPPLSSSSSSQSSSIFQLDDLNLVAENSDSYLDLTASNIYTSYSLSTQPSILELSTPFNGYKYWLVANLSSIFSVGIVASNDLSNWQSISLKNYVYRYYKNETPTLVYGLDNKLHLLHSLLYFTSYYLLCSDSSDGSTWGSPYNVTTQYTYSPTVIIENDTYNIYAINNNSEIVMYSTTTLGSHVLNNQTPQTISIDDSNNELYQNGGDWAIKYIEVKKKGNIYYMLLTLINVNTNETVLRFAKSKDGINWTMGTSNILEKGFLYNWDSFNLDKGCGIPIIDDNNELTEYKLWYSGTSDDIHYYIGHTTAYPNYTTNKIIKTNLSYNNKMITKQVKTKNTTIESLQGYGRNTLLMNESLYSTILGILSYKLLYNATIKSGEYKQITLAPGKEFTIPDGYTLNIEDGGNLIVFEI